MIKAKCYIFKAIHFRVGFKIKTNIILEQCRVVAALMMCDSVARPILQNMTQFNGQYGCSLCLHPGEQVEKGNGSVRVYPYKDVPNRATLQP